MHPVVIAWVLEMFVYACAAVPPAWLFHALPVLESWPAMALWFFLCALAVPLTILVAAGAVCAALPKPWAGTGSLGTDGTGPDANAWRWILFCCVSTIPYRTPACWAVNVLPFPGGLFFRLAGARIHPTVAFPSRVIVMDPYMIEIGARTIIGDGVSLAGHVVTDQDSLRIGPTVIGEGCLIGAYSIFFGDTVIGDGATLLSNSVVSPGTTIPPGEIWGGTPARRIRGA